MCGIFCMVSKFDNRTDHENKSQHDRCSELHKCPCDKIEKYLGHRGPDKVHDKRSNLSENWEGCFVGSVLRTQGDDTVSQPIEDENGNLFLWNGDVLYGALKTDLECDSKVVFEGFKSDPISTVVKIGGPYAFVFWNAARRQLWFGRDVLGRISLLWHVSPVHVTLTSVAHKHSSFSEVPALGVYMVDLAEENQVEIQFYPWAHLKTSFSTLSDIPVTTRNTIVHCTLGDRSSRLTWSEGEPSLDELAIYQEQTSFASLLEHSEISYRVQNLLEVLTESVKCRVTTHPEVCKNCVRSCNHCSVAVLFSGGLDSTILAILAHQFVPVNKPIDLYNVAFQQKNGSFEVPDRLTGQASLKELKTLAPNRLWNFIQIDVTREQLDEMRTHTVTDLLHPLMSVLDDSIGCALWFAARGEGVLNGLKYSSPARVVLVGMGADEQLGGYTRHRNTLRHTGQWAVLGRELASDTDNIARRNLGRDNRIMGDHGRQPRAPFLDERVVAYIDTLPPWHRCIPVTAWPPGKGDKLLLRLLAHRLGLSNAATFPKRALQFGSRIANSREKADHASPRL